MFVNGGFIDLKNLHSAIQARPKKGTNYVVEFAQELAARIKMFCDSSHTWEFWRDRLVPQIVKRSHVPTSERRFLVLSPVVADLECMVAVDLPEAVVPLPLDQVVAWGLSEQEVVDETLTNLRALLPRMSLKTAQATDGTGIVWTEQGSSLNSALLALPELFQLVRDRAGLGRTESGATYGVCVPARQVFLAHTRWGGAASHEVTANLFRRTAALPNPLSEHPFRLLPDGVAEAIP